MIANGLAQLLSLSDDTIEQVWVTGEVRWAGWRLEHHHHHCDHHGHHLQITTHHPKTITTITSVMAPPLLPHHSGVRDPAVRSARHETVRGQRGHFYQKHRQRRGEKKSRCCFRCGRSRATIVLGKCEETMGRGEESCPRHLPF